MTFFWRDYFLHLRPRSWLIVALHFSVGSLVGAAGELFSNFLWFKLIFASTIWAVFLNGGTLALNSAYDKDTTDIGYLDNPPPPPPGLNLFGLIFMLIGAMLVTHFFNYNFFLIYLICFVMSLLYSCPPIRIKAHAGGDILINSLGYGALTFAGGYVAMLGNISLPALVLALGFAFLFATFYPLTQIYQHSYDHQRGDQTFTVWLTPKGALKFATLSLLTAFSFFLFALAIWRAELFSALLLLITLLFWLDLLFRWLKEFKIFPHKPGMYNALYLWAFTDLVIIMIFYGI